jgi:predicted flap endonuclease-1-like 5' DNA nuclease
VLAFAIGVVTGFLTWTRDARGHWFGGWFGFSILLFVAGVLVALFKLLPGRAGLYLELALLFYAAYVAGCWLGSLIRGLFAPARQAEAGGGNREAAVAPTVATAVAPAGASSRSGADSPAAATPTAAGAASADLSRAAAQAPDTGAANDADGQGAVMASVQAADTGAADGRAGAGSGQAAVVAGETAVTALGVAADSPRDVEGVASGSSAATTTPAAVAAGVSASAAGNLPGMRPAALTAPQGGKADDLKRIRGIGRVNEAKLHDLGIYHFAQIAVWTPENVEWAGEYLSFPGRIEREDWVGQAKVLAKGGETDFSRRVDRGEVETSRDEDDDAER